MLTASGDDTRLGFRSAYISSSLIAVEEVVLEGLTFKGEQLRPLSHRVQLFLGSIAEAIVLKGLCRE